MARRRADDQTDPVRLKSRRHHPGGHTFQQYLSFQKISGGRHLFRRTDNNTWRLLRGKKTTTSSRSGSSWIPTSGSSEFHFRFGRYGVERGGTSGDGRFDNETGIHVVARRPMWPAARSVSRLWLTNAAVVDGRDFRLSGTTSWIGVDLWWCTDGGCRRRSTLGRTVGRHSWYVVVTRDGRRWR